MGGFRAVPLANRGLLSVEVNEVFLVKARLLGGGERDHLNRTTTRPFSVKKMYSPPRARKSLCARARNARARVAGGRIHSREGTALRRVGCSTGRHCCLPRTGTTGARRQGVARPPTGGGCFHRRASIDVRAWAAREAMVLLFCWRFSAAETWKPFAQRLPLTSTQCNLGGTRHWFLCPQLVGEGQPCGRRVALLYLRLHVFGYRKCCGLACRLNWSGEIDQEQSFSTPRVTERGIAHPSAPQFSSSQAGDSGMPPAEEFSKRSWVSRSGAPR